MPSTSHFSSEGPKTPSPPYEHPYLLDTYQHESQGLSPVPLVARPPVIPIDVGWLWPRLRVRVPSTEVNPRSIGPPEHLVHDLLMPWIAELETEPRPHIQPHRSRYPFNPCLSLVNRRRPHPPSPPERRTTPAPRCRSVGACPRHAHWRTIPSGRSFSAAMRASPGSARDKVVGR